MKIFGKMIGAFGLVIILFLGVILFSIMESGKLGSNTTRMYEDGIQPSNYLIEIGQLTENTRVQVVTAQLNRQSDVANGALENLDALEELFQGYEGMGLQEEELEVFHQFVERWAAYDKQVRETVGFMLNGEFEKSQFGVLNERGIYSQSQELFEQLVVLNDEKTLEIMNESDQVYGNSVFALYIGLGISVVLAVIIAYFFSKSLVRRLNAVMLRVREIEDGNLKSEPLRVVARDEISVLASSINTMQSTLQTVVNETLISSDQVSASAEELAASADQSMAAAESIATLAQNSTEGAEEQLRSVSEITTAIQELSRSMQSIADNSERMNNHSINAAEQTQVGSTAVHAVNQQMESIAEAVQSTAKSVLNLETKSAEIGAIVSMITTIADQTNLLALNAAIEAARAGEHGKGFAVVADEVRKLAEESRVSAEKIYGMVQEIQVEIHDVTESMDSGTSKVEDGLLKTEDVHQIFGEIEQMVSTVTENAKEVNLSVEEMTKVSNYIVEAVHAVNKIAENSVLSSQESSAASEEQLASMEEISAASDSLASLAGNLQKAIQHFQS